MNLYELFAEILNYPGPHLAACVGDCAGQLERESPQGVELLRRFEKVESGLSIGELQEAYTSVFDMQPECTLNLGYQLLGDDWRRSILLFKLKEVYQTRNFDPGSELPDHLSVLLRFLATLEHSGEAAELVEDCLLPSLSRMAASVQFGESPYRWVLQALLSWLREPRKAPEPGCANDGLHQESPAITTKEESMV